MTAAFAAAILAAATGVAVGQSAPDKTAQLAAKIDASKPKNVILLVGDGMGHSEVTLGRYYGKGAAGRLNMDALPFRGELGHQSAELAAADTCSDETAFWLYSSGSTGMPKGVRHVHSSPMETARLTGQGCLGMREDDLVFSAAKLFFAYGLGNAMSFPMSVGATAVLLPERPTPEVVFRTLKKYQPTLFFGVPTLYAGMLAYAEGTRENSSERLRL